MNSRILRVHVIPVEDCFVHLSSSLIRELKILYPSHKACLKVSTIDKKPGKQEFFTSYCQTPFNSNGNEALNISHEMLSALQLQESDLVTVAIFDQISSLERIYVTPLTNDDWDLLMLNNVSLQDNILQQLQIVYNKQICPIWVSKFVHLKIIIDNIGEGLHVGLLKDSTEIVVQPKSLISSYNNNVKINFSNQNSSSNIAHSNSSCINCEKFIFRTIPIELILLEYDNIYDYSVFISKDHLIKLFPHAISFTCGVFFVEIKLLPKKVEVENKSLKVLEKNSSPSKNSVVVGLCPLIKSMSNYKKIKHLVWPTIYVTKGLSKSLDLKVNSKVLLEPINSVNDDICNIQNVFINLTKDQKNFDEDKILKKFVTQLNNQIKFQKCLAINNLSSIRISNNAIPPIEIILSFSPKRIPYLFINEYNFGMLTFNYNYIDDDFSVKLKTEDNQSQVIENNFSLKQDFFDLKCFDEIKLSGLLCLELGLKCQDNLSCSLFSADNLLIIGPIAAGKTTTAKYFCDKFFSSPYFVKIIWVNGRFLAGKLMDTVFKQMVSHFEECLYYQPAIIVIDDFDDLCHLNSEPNEHAEMANIYLRPLHLMMKMIDCYTSGQNCIRVICTSKPFSQDNQNLFNKQFIDVFKTVINIPKIDKESKKIIVSRCLARIKQKDDVDEDFIMQLCEKMDSYVIQDILDYCDKVLFEVFKSDEKKLNKTILTDIFEKTVPLSLHNVKLFKENKINYSLVGGLIEAKQILTETIIWPSIHSDIFSKCPLKLQSGILLYGAPGTGKTLLAKAVGGESRLNFISVNGPELLSKYVGESEESVRRVFLRRGSDQTGVTDRVVNQFLTQLDGIDTFEGVWVIAATSRPDLIDSALLRPGRIGVKLHCSIPDKNDREDILKIICKNVNLSEDVKLNVIADHTVNYTGADLNGLLYTVLSIADKHFESEKELDDLYNKKNFKITAEHFRLALEQTKPSLSKTEIDKYKRIHELFTGKTKENFNRNMQKVTLA
ncbi:peroxisome biogenesis factor 1 isoform X2 [Daktulosphaira vitifoliae]|uniref:peroxisome biogenesis factor 1 isoform X2 n=1 Tax=Daktulosphaira vitifoliae TaxID=58002 RepID=UPI0021A9AC19|nr:peroxisome biogenesis factor 1 isoform X2 [Daktulosphaira vitifoliae]